MLQPLLGEVSVQRLLTTNRHRQQAARPRRLGVGSDCAARSPERASPLLSWFML